MCTISFFRSIENQHDVYRGKDCMKMFCGFLREHQESYENAINFCIYQEKFGNRYLKDKKISLSLYRGI